MDATEILKQRYESETSALQNEFEQEWNVLRTKRADDKEFSKLHDKYRQLANSVNSDYQGQINNIGEIAKLGESGLVSDVGMTQLRSVLPTETKSALPRDIDVVAEMSKLNAYRDILESDLSAFSEDPGGKRIKDPSKWWFQESKTKPLLYVKTGMKIPDKEGKLVSDLKMANQVEQAEFIRKGTELQRVKQMQNALLASPNITNRMQRAAASSSKFGVGTIASNIAVDLSERKPVEPKPAEKKLEDPLGLR